jgi:hypothetical protein
MERIIILVDYSFLGRGDEVLIKKLSWAGVSIQSKDTVLLIDPLGRTPRGQEKPFSARIGEAVYSDSQFDGSIRETCK